MKKVILLIVICAVLSKNACCEDIIQNDFYLNDREYATEHEVCRILPNTLRINLNVGESYELFADAEGREENLLWETQSAGIVEIYPEKKLCTVYAKAVGDERIRISIDGDDAVYVDVRVTEPPAVVQRTFERKEEKQKSPFSEKLMRLIINGLKLFSGITLFTAAFLLIKKRRRK